MNVCQYLEINNLNVIVYNIHILKLGEKMNFLKTKNKLKSIMKRGNMENEHYDEDENFFKSNK